MPDIKIAPAGAHANQPALPARPRAYRHVDFTRGYDSDIASAMRGVKDVVAYADTLELFFRGSTIPALGTLRRELHDVQRGRGKLPRFKKVVMKADGQTVTVGWRFLVNHPSAEALRVLDRIMMDHRATIHRLDIAVDFVTPTKTRARALMLHFIRHLVLRFGRSNGMPDEEFGTYWVRYKDTRKSPTRNVLVYADKLSKVRGRPCCHLESRFIGSEAVRRMTERFGIEVPSDLIGLRPVELFEHNFILAGDFTQLLDGLQSVPARIVRHLTQDYRAQLLHKFKMLKLPRLNMQALKLPSKMTL